MRRSITACLTLFAFAFLLLLFVVFLLSILGFFCVGFISISSAGVKQVL